MFWVKYWLILCGLNMGLTLLFAYLGHVQCILHFFFAIACNFMANKEIEKYDPKHKAI